MILSPGQNKNLLATIVEFGYAEYGSALEMLAASKNTNSEKSKIGYINHALDEYRHAESVFKVLSMQIKNGVGEFDKSYIFAPQHVVTKGYVDKKSFLVEKLSNQKFIEFVYANEYLAKSSFDDLSKRIKDNESLSVISEIMRDEESHASESIDTLKEIMQDEGRHWGYAKKAHEKLYPKVNLNLAFKRELAKNRMRGLYFKNVKFLGRILSPVINFIILLFGSIVNLITIKTYTNNNINLMERDKASLI